MEQRVQERTRELDRRASESERLNRAMVNLMEDLQEANLNLTRITAQLESSNEELKSFAYSVSHDLRAQLRAIDGFSQALVEDYNDKLDEAGRDYLSRVRSGAEKMAALIDDLLVLSRASRSEMRRESVDLSSLAQELIDELRVVEPEREVNIDIQPGILADVDQGLFRQVFRNLLGNAWKFTRNEKEASIEFKEKQDDQTGERLFYIRDNGAGFDMQYAEKLFGAFQRLHGEAEFEGTGIGLAIVQRIIHRHNGKIWAQAEEGRGATFFFTVG